MGISTKKMSEWLAANGQAVANASKATIEDAIRADIGQLYDGVFIMFHTKSNNIPYAVRVSEWAGYQNRREVAEGVLLFEGGRQLVIAPTEGTGKRWSSNPSSADSQDSVQISGVITTSNRQVAYNDFAGRANTSAIINASTSSNVTNTETYAAGFCNKYSRVNVNGKGLTAGRWWLPSEGEMAMIWANFDKINFALSKISGATQLTQNWYWSSTQNSKDISWSIHLGYGNIDTYRKNNAYSVRPVSAFLL